VVGRAGWFDNHCTGNDNRTDRQQWDDANADNWDHHYDDRCNDDCCDEHIASDLDRGCACSY
jgi:hypothetical protein